MRQRSGRSEAEFMALLAVVAAAGLGESGWDEALTAIAAFFGAAGATIFNLDRAAGSVSDLHTFGLGETQGEYAQRMNAINPRMHRALAQPGCHTAHDYAGLSENEIRRHEFYDWLGRECGVKYFIGSRMMDSGVTHSFVSVDFSPRHGHAEPHEIELFDLLSRHVASAWRLSRTFARLSAMESLYQAVEESVPWGVLGWDRSGRVLCISRRARAVIARADGLVIRKGRLHALRAAEDRTLSLIIARTLRGALGEAPYPGGALAIPRSSGGAPYVLRILPTRCGTEPAADAIVVVAFLSDPDLGLVRNEDLRAIFGLTEREAELALLIAGGWPLKAAAGRMGITHNTARVHLANVMTKAGTRSQVALVALLRSLPGSADDALL